MLVTDRYEIDELVHYEAHHGEEEPIGEHIDPFAEALSHISDDLALFENELQQALEPQQKYLTDTEYGIYQRGKKLRPLLLILSARAVHGAMKLPSKVIKASVSLEMLHVASLIHDDIIDDALLRRGLTSVNASRGTNTAILVGDLQFLQAIRNFVDAIETDSEMGLVKLVLDSAFSICAGELDEISTDPTWSTEQLKQRYMEVIERKTAMMFGLACEVGVALAGGSSTDARRIGFYGRRIGRAFQIMDDILDFLQEDEKSGKTPGIDLLQGRLTLPIIYAMEELGDSHFISRHVRQEQPIGEDITAAIQAVNSTQALSRAYADARYEALDSLKYLSRFEDSSYLRHMKSIAMYIVDRSF